MTSEVAADRFCSGTGAREVGGENQVWRRERTSGNDHTLSAERPMLTADAIHILDCIDARTTAAETDAHRVRPERHALAHQLWNQARREVVLRLGCTGVPVACSTAHAWAQTSVAVERDRQGNARGCHARLARRYSEPAR